MKQNIVTVKKEEKVNQELINSIERAFQDILAGRIKEI